MKANWNAIVDENNRKIGLCVIVRDRMGEVLVTLSAPKPYITHPVVAKALEALTATKGGDI